MPYRTQLYLCGTILSFTFAIRDCTLPLRYRTKLYQTFATGYRMLTMQHTVTYLCYTARLAGLLDQFLQRKLEAAQSAVSPLAQTLAVAIGQQIVQDIHCDLTFVYLNLDLEPRAFW